MAFRWRLLSALITTVSLVIPVSVFAATILSVPQVLPSRATKGVETSITVEPSATDGSVKGCSLYVNGKNQGVMDVRSRNRGFEKTYTFAQAGEYSVYASCQDQDNHSTNGTTRTIVVSEPADDEGPVITELSPFSTTVGKLTGFGGKVKDNRGVGSCTLFVDGVEVGPMTLQGSTVRTDYTFKKPGITFVAIRCKDTSGNESSTNSVPVTVLAALNDLVPGDLFKIACPVRKMPDDPCSAVYYYGTDGKRHAFPNERIYKTWYKDFGSIVIVTPELMASIPLGRNVAYHPGSRLIKFTSSPTVYAVSRGGVLHPIASEPIAKGIFGDSWSSQIDDVPDVFFGHYKVGEPIDSTRGFDVKKEQASVRNISENL